MFKENELTISFWNVVIILSLPKLCYNLNNLYIYGGFKMAQDTTIRRKCRICLQTHDQYSSFFEPYGDFSISIFHILTNMLHFKIVDDPEMPRMICESCNSIIITFFNLMKDFQEREDCLKESLSKKEIIYMEENDFDHYVECGAGPYYKESDEDDIIEITQNDICINQPPENECANHFLDETSDQTECKKPTFDEQGNEIITTVKYSCEPCGDCFMFKSAFSQHMVSRHNKYILEDEFSEYTTEITLKVPPPPTGAPVKIVKRNYVTRKAAFQCQVCKIVLLNKPQLKEHYNLHKTHVCEHCGAAFIKNAYLRDHLLMHSTEKRFTCDICGKKFKYRNGLLVHKNIHVNFRGFMCDTCGQGFNTRSTLYTHIKLKHTNERNFQCPECDLTFKVKSWLDKHYKRRHTANRTKDFVCAICGIAYLNKTTLTRHTNDKHTGTPVRHHCHVCEKSYSMKTKLNLHLQKKHNIILNRSTTEFH